MVRPLRIEYEGATYHVTSRGDRQEPIVWDDTDRFAFIRVLAEALERFDAQVWAYCLMDNHYHLVLHTHHANLSRLMRQINGVYTQKFNRRHGVAGHLFQGRFKSILIDSDRYLLEVCRYVDLNPVRAGMVVLPQEYAWSSYLAHAGKMLRPDWLDSRPLYEHLAHDPVAAAAKYTEFVAQGDGIDLWGEHLRQQRYLGDDAFIDRMQKLSGLNDQPKSQVSGMRRHPAASKPISGYVLSGAGKVERNAGIVLAFVEGGYTQTAIASAFGVSVSTVSRVIGRSKCNMGDLTPKNRGFTMVELVMVIVIIGIMGAVAAPRFFGTSVFQSRGYADQLKATLRYAQKTAVAQNRFICVTFASASVTLSLDATAPGSAHATATCPGSSMTSPSGQMPYVVSAPGGVTLSGATSFYFDTLGRPSATQSILVSSTPVTVEAETGYVH